MHPHYHPHHVHFHHLPAWWRRREKKRCGTCTTLWYDDNIISLVSSLSSSSSSSSTYPLLAISIVLYRHTNAMCRCVSQRSAIFTWIGQYGACLASIYVHQPCPCSRCSYTDRSIGRIRMIPLTDMRPFFRISPMSRESERNRTPKRVHFRFMFFSSAHSYPYVCVRPHVSIGHDPMMNDALTHVFFVVVWSIGFVHAQYVRARCPDSRHSLLYRDHVWCPRANGGAAILPSAKLARDCATPIWRAPRDPVLIRSWGWSWKSIERSM